MTGTRSRTGWPAQAPLPPGALRALAAGLAEGLAAIHAAGLVHRDLKPSNVLLAADGPRVIDFGISRALDATALTQAGVAIGTPGFMSPEQAKGGQVGPPSDVFSLGGVLTHAVAGHGPFGDGNPAAIMFRVRYDPPDLDGVPGGFRSLLARCLAKDPDERPAVARVLAELGDAGLARDWQGGKTPIPNAPAAPPCTETSRTPVPVRPGVTRSAPTPGAPARGTNRGARALAAVFAVLILAAALGTGIALSLRHEATPSVRPPKPANLIAVYPAHRYGVRGINSIVGHGSHIWRPANPATPYSNSTRGTVL